MHMRGKGFIWSVLVVVVAILAVVGLMAIL